MSQNQSWQGMDAEALAGSKGQGPFHVVGRAISFAFMVFDSSLLCGFGAVVPL
jgi:hypothetical protein